jgi:hypothetical protein
MAKKVATRKSPPKRRRTLSEKVLMVLGIIIALSMVLTLVLTIPMGW